MEIRRKFGNTELKYYFYNMKPKINYKKIKRDLIKRDTGFDTRFTSKVVKSEKIYSRKKVKDSDLSDVL